MLFAHPNLIERDSLWSRQHGQVRGARNVDPHLSEKYPFIAFERGVPFTLEPGRVAALRRGRHFRGAANRGGPAMIQDAFPSDLESVFSDVLGSIQEEKTDPIDLLRRAAHIEVHPRGNGLSLEIDGLPKDSIEKLRDLFRDPLKGAKSGESDEGEEEEEEEEEERVVEEALEELVPSLRAHDPLAAMLGSVREARPFESLNVARPDGKAPLTSIEELGLLSPEDGALGPWSRNRTTGAMFLRIPVRGFDPRSIRVKIAGNRLVLSASQIVDDEVADDGQVSSFEEEDMNEEFSLPYRVSGNVKASVKGDILKILLPPPPRGVERRKQSG
eukprot:g3618.t1